MKNALENLNQTFNTAPISAKKQYLDYHRLFKREFSKFLKENNVRDIQFSKPNHFDISGFFTTNENKIWYFSLGDLRWDKSQLLVRTATDYRDYRGGGNNFIYLNRGVDTFKNDFLRLLSNNY